MPDTIQTATEELIDAKIELEKQLLEFTGNKHAHLQCVIAHTLAFWEFIHEEKKKNLYKNIPAQRRLVRNIRLVTNALEKLADRKATVTEQHDVIRHVEYKASTKDWVLAQTKRIVLSLCAAATGFLLGCVMGATMTGGIGGLPAAFFTSVKAAALVWGGAGAATFGPVTFGLWLAKDEMTKKTSSPVELEMLKIRQVLNDKNDYDLACSLDEKMEQLKASYAGEATPVYQMLSTILARAKTLESSSTDWFILDRASRLTKAKALYRATEQVLEQLLLQEAPPAHENLHLEKRRVLELDVMIEGRQTSYQAVLETQRHFLTDTLFTVFRRGGTRTQQEAELAFESPQNIR